MQGHKQYLFNLYMWSRDFYYLSRHIDILLICTLIFADVSVLLPEEKKAVSILNYLTLRNFLTFQMTVHWLLLTQLRCIACIIYPCIVFHLLQCHGFSASLLFHMRNACFPISCLYCTVELVEKIPVSGFMSQHLVSSNPSPCHSSLLPFTMLTAIPLGASLYQFPPGLQEPCKRQSGMMWF